MMKALVKYDVIPKAVELREVPEPKIGADDVLLEVRSVGVCGSDIEYCLRLLHAGLRNVYLSPARLYHLESRTRNPNDSDPDRLRFRQLLKPYRWQGDPFYNENLSLYDNCGKMRSRWE